LIRIQRRKQQKLWQSLYQKSLRIRQVKQKMKNLIRLEVLGMDDFARTGVIILERGKS